MHQEVDLVAAFVVPSKRGVDLFVGLWAAGGERGEGGKKSGRVGLDNSYPCVCNTLAAILHTRTFT